MIRSVLGRLDPARLGVTLLHSHSVDDSEAVAAELRAFAGAGGQTVIEAMPTTVDAVRLAEAAGVNIVRLTKPLMYLRPTEACQAFREMDGLQARGIDLRNLAVHAADEVLADHDVLCSIAVRGAWLGIEIAEPRWLGPVQRLVAAGWAGQILAATTVCGKLTSAIGGVRHAGLADGVVEEILIQNPVRYLISSGAGLEGGAHSRG